MMGLPFDTQSLIDLCRQNDATMVGIFGSTVRGEAGPGSDVDVLVRFARPISLLKLVALERRLGTLIGRPVDLVSEHALHPALRRYVLRDLMVIYEAQ